MKVPTYKREGVFQLATGARPMQIQRSGQAEARLYEQQARTFSEVGQFALDTYQKDLQMRREIQDAEAGNYADKELIRLQAEAAEADPDKAESLFDAGVRNLKVDLADRFDTQERANAFNLKLDGAVIGKRLNVTRDSKKRRIEKGLAVFTETRDTLRQQAVFGNAVERKQALDELASVREKMVAQQFLSPEDAAKQALADDKYVFVEGLQNRINSATTIEQYEALKEEISTLETTDFKPSTIAKLRNLTQVQINALLREEDSAESERIRKEIKASENELLAFRMHVRRLADDGKEDEIRGLYETFIDGNAPDVYTAADADRAMAFLESRLELKKGQMRGLIRDNGQNIKNNRTGLVNGEDYGDGAAFQEDLRVALTTGDPQNIIAAQANLEMFEANRAYKQMSPTQLSIEITRLKGLSDELLFPEIPDEQMTKSARKMLRSELVKFAEDKLASVEKQTENGQILDYAQKAGVVEVEPIDLNNIDAWVAGRNKSLTMASAFMAQGSLQQDDATVFDLGKVKAFTKAERAFIQSWASTASPQDVADFVLGIAPLASRVPGIYEEINDSGAELLAVAAAIGDPDIARTLFAGLGREPLVENKKLDFAEVFDERVGDVFTFENSTADNRKHNLNATIAVYQAIRTDQIEFDQPAFEKALELVTGGIGERGEFKVQLPRGVSENEFNQAFNVIDAEMLEMLVPEGFRNMTYEQAAIRISQSRIRSTQDNEYTPVFDDMQMFLRNNGSPLSFKWNEEFENLAKEAGRRESGRMDLDSMDVELLIPRETLREGM